MSSEITSQQGSAKRLVWLCCADVRPPPIRSPARAQELVRAFVDATTPSNRRLPLSAPLSVQIVNANAADTTMAALLEKTADYWTPQERWTSQEEATDGTPVQYAAHFNKEKTLTVLLRAGADPFRESGDLASAWVEAASNACVGTTRAIMDHRPPTDHQLDKAITAVVGTPSWCDTACLNLLLKEHHRRAVAAGCSCAEVGGALSSYGHQLFEMVKRRPRWGLDGKAVAARLMLLVGYGMSNRGLDKRWSRLLSAKPDRLGHSWSVAVMRMVVVVADVEREVRTANAEVASVLEHDRPLGQGDRWTTDWDQLAPLQNALAHRLEAVLSQTAAVARSTALCLSNDVSLLVPHDRSAPYGCVAPPPPG